MATPQAKNVRKGCEDGKGNVSKHVFVEATECSERPSKGSLDGYVNEDYLEETGSGRT